MSTNHSHFSHEQKIGFIFMLVFAILTVGLAGLQLRNTIYGPFVIHATKKDPATALAQTDEETRLKNLDTDQDGLDDFDEIKVYGTSAYLPDTDSDGINDKLEIDAGSNPLCPEGEKCNQEDIGPTSTVLIGSSPLLNTVQAPTTLVAPLDAATTSTGSTANVDLEALIKNPAELRQILIASGKIKAEDLEKINDATLIKKVQDIINTSTSTKSQ